MTEEREPMPESGKPTPRLRAIMGEAEFDRLLAEGKSTLVFDLPLTQLSQDDLIAVIAYLGEQQTRERGNTRRLIEAAEQLQLAHAAQRLRNTGNPQ